jgi:3-oxoacyl-[acyl-carrier protein] reductase
MEKDHEIFEWSKPDVDIASFDSIEEAADKLPELIDIVINCAGVNFINYLPNVTEQAWNNVMDVNARSIFLTTKLLLPKLHGGTVLNIVSNASRIPMTASLAYNASKAAALMMTKQLARELIKTHNITVFSVSPNKLSGTFMSSYIEKRVMELRGWTAEQASKYQLDALPAGEETDSDTLAEFIAFLLSSKQRHKYLAGCDIQYGGP